MKAIEESPPSSARENLKWLRWLSFAFLGLIGAIIAVLSEGLVLMIAVLLVGVPFAALVINRPTRRTAIILLLVFVPLTSILKAITGSRFAPLTFDLGILFACILHLGESLIRKKIRLSWLEFFFGSFLVVAFLQMFNPNVPTLQAGIEGFRKFAFMGITFYVGKRIMRTRDLSFFRWSMIFVSVPIVLYGIKQFVFLSAIDRRMISLATASTTTYLMGGWIRPFSTLPGPFHLGLYIIVVGLLVICQIIARYTKRSTRLLLLAVLILQLTALFLTRTKGNWVGFVVGVAVLILLQIRVSFKSFIRLASLTLIGGIIILSALSVTSATATEVLEEAVIAVVDPLEAPTFIFRLNLWSEKVFPAITAKPLIGYGTSSAGEGLRNLYRGTESSYFASHNLYFKIFLELGVLGLMLFLMITGGSLIRGWQALQRVDPLQKTKMIILQWSLAVVVSFLVAGLVIPTLDAYPANYYFWLLLGLLSGDAMERESI